MAEALVIARMDSFIRTRDEIRTLPEIHDCAGRCSAHLRLLPYDVVSCDVCGHTEIRPG